MPDVTISALGHEKIGHTDQGLWHRKGVQLPAYIQHIARDLMDERGMDESHAIATAVSRCKAWCAGGDKVKADTRAKACAAVAEWEALKTSATAAEPAQVVAFNPAHQPAGSPAGGQFAPGGGGGGAGTPTNANPVQQGMTGQQVKDLQSRLNALGAHLKVDGQFGPATLAAVKAYQSAHGLKVDGLVGPKTTAGLRLKQQTPAKPATTHKQTAPKKTPAPAKPKAPAKPATTPKKTVPAPAKTKTPAPKAPHKAPVHKAPAKPKTLTPHQAHLAHLAHLRHLHGAAGNPPVALPALITIPGVDILAAGTWQLSSGRQTFTRADLTAATEAASCPAVGPPVIKIGHLDDRFTPDPSHDGEPAIGKVTNLRADSTGNKLIGDMAGMPGWLGAVAASAFPRRSVEGTYNFPCQIGHTHPFVITAVALLGITPPGVGVLGGLDDIAALYGLTSTTAAGGWRTPPAGQEGHPMAVTEEDVRRAYYAAGGAPPSWWITELQMDPTQLIVADEATTKVYRVPFRINGTGIEFGDPQEFATYSDVAAARGTGPLIVFASALESRSVTATWDAAAAQANLGDNPSAAQIKALYALPGDTKSASSLPHHDVAPGGKVGAANPQGCSAAIGALNGSRGGVTNVPAEAKKAAYAHLAAHLRAVGQTPPDLKASTGDRLDRLRAIRAATGDNPDVAQLTASLDALLDQATEMCKGMDRANADPMMVQMADMMAAAEELADQLMDALGIPDPDEAGETPVAAEAGLPAGENFADWPVEDQTGDVEAAPAHGACSTTHEHPHPAFGAQGSDQTHTHSHAHTNDAVHNHAHDPTSAASAATAKAKGAPEVEFSTEQLTAMKAKLGKKEDEDLTAADIAAAFTAPQVAATASNGGKDSNEGALPPIGDGTYLVDGEIIRDWQTRAARGDHADHQLRIYERDVVLAAAVRDGKFPQAKLDVYKGRWDKDPEGTRELVESLAAGLVPMGGAIGSAGGDPDLPGDFEEQKAYRDLYPEDAKGGISHAPGVRGGAFRG